MATPKHAITPFTMTRDVVIASKSGHSIKFEANVPTHVPKAMQHEVLAAGGVPADPDAIQHEEEKREIGVSPSDEAERAELLLIALNDIKARGVREEFTAQGVPKSKTVEKALGFSVPSTEIAEAWATLVAPKE